MEQRVIFLFVLVFSCISEAINSDKCPSPDVHKQTIIRSSESIKNGASLLQKIIVKSASYCYAACCNSKSCNVAVMHYKKLYNDLVEDDVRKYCFLFDCGSPSVCTFGSQDRYAVIQLNYPIKTTFSPTITTINTIKPSATHHTTKQNPTAVVNPNVVGDKCPPGVPVAMCAANPCEGKTCSANVKVMCKPSYCGGCYAKFYNANGAEVKCNKKGLNSHKTKTGYNEEVVEVAETDYGETPKESLPKLKHKHAKPIGDPYGPDNTERRKWVDSKPGNLKNVSLPATTTPIPKVIIDKVVVSNPLMSVPLLIALLICIVLIIGLIYRFKCAPKGKPKKFPVDDGDYLINGMYL